MKILFLILIVNLTLISAEVTHHVHNLVYNTHIQQNLDDCGYFGDSVSECVDRLQATLKFWTEENWNCAVFYQKSGSQTWKYSYQATSRYYPIIGMCGKSYTNINTTRMQNSCRYAADRCGTNLTCALNDIKNLQSNNNSNTQSTYRFCNNASRYNVMVTRDYDLTAQKGLYGGYVYNYKNIRCTAYCAYDPV